MIKEEIDNIEDYLKNKLPKIESTIPIANFGSVDLDDLMDSIKHFKEVPKYDEVLRENKKLRSQLEENNKIIDEVKKYCKFKSKFNCFEDSLTEKMLDTYVNATKKDILEILERGKYER